MTVSRGTPAPVVRTVRTEIDPKLSADAMICAVALPTDRSRDFIAAM